MRMRLTPAADKMVISHMKGYLLVIHDLNLQTLSQDLEGIISHIKEYLLVIQYSGSQFSNSQSGFRRYNISHEGISPGYSIFMISIFKLSVRI